MTRRIFRSVFLASLAVFLAGLALVVGTMYNYFSDRQAEQLRVEARLAANGVERAGLEYLETVDDGEVRLTWIAADGTVIYDSDAEAGEMENHAEREEFREALEYGFGEGERTSSTLSEKTVYYAIRLSDGSVLRTAESHYTLPALLFGIIQPLVLILVLALLLSGWLASRLSKRIVGPLNAIDLDKPLENDAYDELSPLLTRVEQQQRQISGQLEELRRRKEEFAAVTGSMSEGLILIDSQGLVMSINRSAREIFGADGVGEGSDVLAVDRSRELRELLERSASGRAECCLSRGEREYLLTASPVETGGERRGTVLLAVDVTEKQRAERLRREFTANVSHELKTPLHSIMGAAELLQDGLVKPEDRDPLPRPHKERGRAARGARAGRHKPLPPRRGRGVPARGHGYARPRPRRGLRARERGRRARCNPHGERHGRARQRRPPAALGDSLEPRRQRRQILEERRPREH